jgi:hypothetical protein
LWAAILEPPVPRTINRDQLAAAVPAITGLIWSGSCPIAVLPPGTFDHQLAQRIVANPDPVTLDQILAHQRRTKIVIMRSHTRDDLFAQDSASQTPDPANRGIDAALAGRTTDVGFQKVRNQRVGLPGFGNVHV